MKRFGGQLKQAGISLLEVLLSLAIISIILVMAMQYFTTAGNNQKLNMVRTFIGADMAAIQGYGINNNGYTGIGWTALVSNGYLSQDTKSLNCDSNGTACNQVTPWGDDVTLNAPAAGDTLVTLTIPLPSDALCQNLVQSYGAQTVSCDAGTATVNVSTGTSAT